MKAKALSAAMFIAVLAGCATSPRPTTVAAVDLQRYSGRWYEIARYPNWFQRKCVGQAVAEYTPQADGRIQVVNTCATKDGRTEKATGTATVVPGSGDARLKVRFGGVPFAGDYWILALDPDYRWALVGHPSRKYLWILARDRQISPELYKTIVNEAVRQGYDAGKILRTP